jgi:hypothetical protein
MRGGNYLARQALRGELPVDRIPAGASLVAEFERFIMGREGLHEGLQLLWRIREVSPEADFPVTSVIGNSDRDRFLMDIQSHVRTDTGHNILLLVTNRIGYEEK